MFGFLGVNGRQIYPFYSNTPPSKHGLSRDAPAVGVAGPAAQAGASTLTDGRMEQPAEHHTGRRSSAYKVSSSVVYDGVWIEQAAAEHQPWLTVTARTLSSDPLTEEKRGADEPELDPNPTRWSSTNQSGPRKSTRIRRSLRAGRDPRVPPQ